MNGDGEIVKSRDEAVGLKVTVEITHPQWIIFGDEVGTDLSQKEDGHVGGQKFVVSKGTRANIKSSHKDLIYLPYKVYLIRYFFSIFFFTLSSYSRVC